MTSGRYTVLTLSSVKHWKSVNLRSKDAWRQGFRIFSLRLRVSGCKILRGHWITRDKQGSTHPYKGVYTARRGVS